MTTEIFAQHTLPREFASQIFQARGRQFVDRLGWDLKTGADGSETDQYDDPEARYVVVHAQGRVRLSCRLRPARFGTMVEDCFDANFPEARRFFDWQRGNLWELTRFCRSPDISLQESAGSLREMSFMLDTFRDHHLATGFVAAVYPHFTRFLDRIGTRYLKLAEGWIDDRKTCLICITHAVDIRGARPLAGMEPRSGRPLAAVAEMAA